MKRQEGKIDWAAVLAAILLVVVLLITGVVAFFLVKESNENYSIDGGVHLGRKKAAIEYLTEYELAAESDCWEEIDEWGISLTDKLTDEELTQVCTPDGEPVELPEEDSSGSKLRYAKVPVSVGGKEFMLVFSNFDDVVGILPGA